MRPSKQTKVPYEQENLWNETSDGGSAEAIQCDQESYSTSLLTSHEDEDLTTALYRDQRLPQYLEEPLPTETIIEWEYEYVDVVETVEVFEHYEVPLIERKVVETVVNVDSIKEIPVEIIEYEDVEEITVQYEIEEHRVVYEEIVEEEIIEWNEIRKEVPIVVIEKIIEDKVVEEPIMVDVPHKRIKYVTKEIPVIKYVDNEIIEEVEEIVEVLRTVEIHKPKIIEKVKNVIKEVIEYVDEIVEKEVPEYQIVNVEKRIPAEPNIVEVIREIPVVNYVEEIEWEEETEWEIQEVERKEFEITERHKYVDIFVDRPTEQEQDVPGSPVHCVKHPETGMIFTIDDFDQQFPEFEILSSCYEDSSTSSE